MFPNHKRQLLKNSQIRYHRRRLSKKVKQSSRFHQILLDLQRSKSRFSSYTVTELEPVCQKIAIKQMSSTTTVIASCPWICLFCEDLIYEPVTLYCGHTYCEQCIKDEEHSPSLINCPRCSKEDIESSFIYANNTKFSKNHFLKQIIERSETFKFKCENILLCHQAQNECKNKNYQKALDIYSNILDKYKDNHTALYGRAKTYIALKQVDKALIDTEQVILLRPQWAKGYYCRSEIFFEMKRYTSALLSSLQGLTLNPEDPLGKQIMAQHLHAVLNDKESPITPEHESDTSLLSNDKESPITPEHESDTPLLSNDNAKETTTSAVSDTKLLMCKSTQSSSCLCTLFDCKKIRGRDFDCSICVNLLWFPVTTPCGHVFCRECLIRSIDNTQAQCPMCKNSLEQFFPILIQSSANKTEIISQIIETYLPNEYNERRLSYEQENIQGVLIPRLSASNTEPIIFEIPIFVCVLTLPCCTCPLHVFEPRYRLMMRRAMETQSRTFGMCQLDEQTGSFSDYGTLLFIRDLAYTLDGRSIVDTIGQQRFRVIDRGMRDGYSTARVQLIQDQSIEQDEFDDLYELNRNTYKRVRAWFDQLDAYRRTLISRRLETYPSCDDLIQGSTDGPIWCWIMLDLLPIEPDLQYTALSSQSFRTRLLMINNTIDFLLNQQQQPITVSTD